MAYLILAKTTGTGAILPESPWMLEFYHPSSTEDDSIYEVLVDSSGNPNIVGQTKSMGQGEEDFFVSKVNKDGTVNWQRVLGSAVQDRSRGGAIDSSGNIYACGQSEAGGASTLDDNGFIAKYNSSGALQWKRVIGDDDTDPGAYNNQRLMNVVIDSQGDIIGAGASTDVFTDTGSVDDMFICKYNSSGVVQWQKALGDSNAQVLQDIAIDSSDNIYVSGYSWVTASSNHHTWLAKLNTSGVIQWQRTLGHTGGSAINYSVETDSSGNVYVSLDSNKVAKYNSSGVLQWQKIYTNIAGAGRLHANGSELFLVAAVSPNTKMGALLNIDTSNGEVNWARSVEDTNDTSNSVNFGDVKTSPSTSTVFVGASWNKNPGGNRESLLMGLPLDGTGTGLYGTELTYAVLTSVASNSTFTDASSSLGEIVTTFPSTDPSMTDTAGAFLTNKHVTA